MKQSVIIILFSLFVNSCISQVDSSNYSKQIKEQAETMAQFLLKKDFEGFTRYINPKIVEMMGGHQQMKEKMEKGTQEMESGGTRFLNITFGEPSKIIIADTELQCTIPETMEIKVPEGKLISKTTLIAISLNKGENWYFMDTSGKDIETMRRTMPNLSEKLIIPKNPKETLVKD